MGGWKEGGRFGGYENWSGDISLSYTSPTHYTKPNLLNKAHTYYYTKPVHITYSLLIQNETHKYAATVAININNI